MTLEEQAREYRAQLDPLDTDYAMLVLEKEQKAAELEELKARMREVKSRRDPIQIAYEETLRAISAEAGAAKVVPIVTGS